MNKKSKRILPLNKIDDLDDETYHFIKYLDKQIDKLQWRVEEAEDTLNKTLDLINSSEELTYFNNEKKTIRKPIEDYFKRWKK